MSDALRHRLQSSLGSAHTIACELGGDTARVFVTREERLRRNTAVRAGDAGGARR